MKITTPLKTFVFTAMLTTLPVIKSNALIPQRITQDTFEHEPLPCGTNNQSVLNLAPNPSVIINGQHKKAVIVVDLTKNILYKYDNGIPEKAYLIASGKKSTPTTTGTRIVTHVETYPYRSAPRYTKRRRNPNAYGPNIICLNKIDTKTAEQTQTGEFIHGTNEPYSIGQYVSHGCMRMDNEVIKELSQQVKRGDIVLIK